MNDYQYNQFYYDYKYKKIEINDAVINNSIASGSLYVYKNGIYSNGIRYRFEGMFDTGKDLFYFTREGNLYKRINGTYKEVGKINNIITKIEQYEDLRIEEFENGYITFPYDELNYQSCEKIKGIIYISRSKINSDFNRGYMIDRNSGKKLYIDLKNFYTEKLGDKNRRKINSSLSTSFTFCDAFGIDKKYSTKKYTKAKIIKEKLQEDTINVFKNIIRKQREKLFIDHMYELIDDVEVIINDKTVQGQFLVDPKNQMLGLEKNLTYYAGNFYTSDNNKVYDVTADGVIHEFENGQKNTVGTFNNLIEVIQSKKSRTKLERTISVKPIQQVNYNSNTNFSQNVYEGQNHHMPSNGFESMPQGSLNPNVDLNAAQRLYGKDIYSNGRRMIQISNDGRIRNNSGDIIGDVTPDGSIKIDGDTVGSINSDGSIRMDDGRQGNISSEGNVFDDSGDSDGGYKFFKDENKWYVATEVVKGLGNKPKHMDLLQTGVSLRNNYLSNFKEGRDFLEKYDIIGPKIVENLKQNEKSIRVFKKLRVKTMYKKLYRSLVKKPAKLCKTGKKENAFLQFKNVIEKLESRYLKNKNLEK